jgi:hypothetical protein
LVTYFLSTKGHSVHFLIANLANKFNFQGAMIKVILDIPNEKLHAFLQMLAQLGIDKHSVASHAGPAFRSTKQLTPQKFLLFDWEFFYNELEFE